VKRIEHGYAVDTGDHGVKSRTADRSRRTIAGIFMLDFVRTQARPAGAFAALVERFFPFWDSPHCLWRFRPRR
jgi:hypothetical protein